jgi:hypothetical protein
MPKGYLIRRRGLEVQRGFRSGINANFIPMWRRMCVLDGPFVLANAATLNLAPSALMKLSLWKR